MIPVLAIVRIRHRRGGFSMWAPLILLWPLMGLLAAVLSPLWGPYVLARRRNPLVLAGRVCGLIAALKGAVLEVDSPSASVGVRLI